MATEQSTINTFSFHPGQRYVWERLRKMTWIAAGRRWRKSTFCLTRAITTAAQGKSVLWGTINYSLCREMMREAEKVCGRYADYNQSTSTVTFPNGGRILFKSLEEPDNIRGYTADGGIVIDEAGFIREEAYSKCIRPTILGNKGAWVLVVGTPNGFNWFQRGFDRALAVADDPNGTSIAFHAPTLGCKVTEQGLVRVPHPMENPEITFDEMLEIFNGDDCTLDDFRQEYLAEFITDSGSVFSFVGNAVDRGRTEATAPDESRIYTLGFDIARYKDYSVISVFDDEGKQVYLRRMQDTHYETQCAEVKRVAALYRAKVFMDSNGLGDMPYERLKQLGVDVVAFPINQLVRKTRLIEHLQIAFEKKRLRLLDNQVQENELLAYEYNKTPTGKLSMSAPSGKNDDIVIADALAVWGAVKPIQKATLSRSSDDPSLNRFRSNYY